MQWSTQLSKSSMQRPAWLCILCTMVVQTTIDSLYTSKFDTEEETWKQRSFWGSITCGIVTPHVIPPCKQHSQLSAAQHQLSRRFCTTHVRHAPNKPQVQHACCTLLPFTPLGPGTCCWAVAPGRQMHALQIPTTLVPRCEHLSRLLNPYIYRIVPLPCSYKRTMKLGQALYSSLPATVQRQHQSFATTA
jgi:hypothetical protein